MTQSPFSDTKLRNAFFSSLDGSDDLPDTVAIVGSDPFGHTDLTLFIREQGIDVVSSSHGTEVVILGRQGWSTESLDQLVKRRSGRLLKAYSQEMFLAFVAARSDPFQHGRDVLEQYGKGHPALQYLADMGFDWLTTLVFPGAGHLPDDDWPDESPLKRLGYHVGRNAPSQNARRELLALAFTSPLPQVISPQYMEKWGRPDSKERLYQIATHLAAMCRNFKGRSTGSYQTAIRHYQNDLAWLKDTYYRGRFTFEWPSTHVR